MKVRSFRFFKGLILSLLVIICSFQVSSQVLKKDYYKMEYADRMVFNPGNSQVAPFFISSKPVTNKEYILYLLWNNLIYADYPEEVYKALPGLKSDSMRDQYNSPFYDSASFSKYLNNSESFVADYLFNPKYINDPVIGITWQQANSYCQWISDRYNEYTLLNKKYLKYDQDQINENIFTTETFIFWQYEGNGGKQLPFDRHAAPSGFGYVNYLLRPTFHIASKYELELNAKPELPAVSKKIEFVYEVTSIDGSPFLWPFYDRFLSEEKGSISITTDRSEGPLYLSSVNPKPVAGMPKELTEWCQDSYLSGEEKSITDIYCQLGYRTANYKELLEKDSAAFPKISKDRFGRLPFIITGENKEKEFEIVKALDIQKNNKESNSCYLFDNLSKTVINRNGDVFTSFRYAVNAIKK